MDATMRRTSLGGLVSVPIESPALSNVTPEIAVWLAKREARSQIGRRRTRRTSIYERDSWTCQLCLGPVKRRLPATHPGAATLDHRVPRADGGSSNPSNLQLAHAICNHVRGDMPLALVDPELYACVREAALAWLHAEQRYRMVASRRERARRRLERFIRRARKGESFRSPGRSAPDSVESAKPGVWVLPQSQALYVWASNR